ncbi:uncharacterized protein LOC124832337 [Vigna umbellata]|nr:uncharacterized protein LOC124832337 [Vigna umbellata]
MENPASTKVTVNNHHSAVKPPCLHLPQPRDAPATLNSKTCSEVAVNHEAPPRLHEPAIQNPKNHSLFVLSRLRHSQTQNPRSNQKRKRKTLTTILHRAPMSLVPTMPVATGGIVDAPLFHCFYFEFHCWGLLIQSMWFVFLKSVLSCNAYVHKLAFAHIIAATNI